MSIVAESAFAGAVTTGSSSGVCLALRTILNAMASGTCTCDRIGCGASFPGRLPLHENGEIFIENWGSFLSIVVISA
jgi:hypothetical protein